MKDTVRGLLAAAINRAFPEADANDLAFVERTKNPAHGEFASNAAMRLASSVGAKPRDIATAIHAELADDPAINRVEIAGPGFLNFFPSADTFRATVDTVLDAGADYGCSNVGAGQSVLVEFVSANPTGPLHVGHGRGAAYGDCVARLLSAAGFDVKREYYVNDAGRQMAILAASTYLRYLQHAGETLTLPNAAYQGDYVNAAGEQIHAERGRELAVPYAELAASAGTSDEDDADTHIDGLINAIRGHIGDVAFEEIRRRILDQQLAGIKRDLTRFGVDFDRWFFESSVVDDGAVARAINRLDERGVLYTADNARWFAATRYGDDKDRVVERSDGRLTYFAADIAYHMNKLDRGFDRLVDILGADHHGYVARVRAAVAALSGDPDRLDVWLVQFANLYRGRERLSMSTRAGQYVTLAELCDEVGVDAARLFYVLRANEQHLDFDLSLATSKTNDNPVYYLQYAHARICRVAEQADARGTGFDRELADLATLEHDAEHRLIRILDRYGEVVAAAAVDAEPHAIVSYLREVADAFHSYYNAVGFLVDDLPTCHARLALVYAARQVLANGLKLIGVSAPERM
ncbi:arginine--tRNA ligase [Salinisphaera sp. USBA-960]|nr:arginine--tRNA ligase [Salifodinibacter halophilus]NNC27232.1 arginine--tRNA ligase [Salifodinibacter halophilus]